MQHVAYIRIQHLAWTRIQLGVDPNPAIGVDPDPPFGVDPEVQLMMKDSDPTLVYRKKSFNIVIKRRLAQYSYVRWNTRQRILQLLYVDKKVFCFAFASFFFKTGDNHVMSNRVKCIQCTIEPSEG
jgi:hypothetical protein